MLLQLLASCAILTCRSMAQSIAVGKGNEIMYNGDTPLYPKSLLQNAPIVSTSKYDNHTFYFYFDKKVNKYYVRDDTCRFLCLNPCGVAYMSDVLVKHHCKFRIEKNDVTGMYRMLVPSNVKSGKNPYNRYIKFNDKLNIVEGKINVTNIKSIPYDIKISPIDSEQKKCTNIAKLAAINLDTSNGSRCELPKITELNAADQVREIKVYSSNRFLYHLKLDDGYVTNEGKLDRIMGDHTRFHREQLFKNTYVFRNTDNCKYLCMNVCGRVYMSQSYKADCIINVLQTTLIDRVYLKFDRHNMYLTHDKDGFLTNATTHVHGSQVELSMTENNVLDNYDKKCNMIRITADDDEDEDSDDCSTQLTNNSGIKNSLYPITKSVLPTLLFYIVMKNGNFQLSLDNDGKES